MALNENTIVTRLTDNGFRPYAVHTFKVDSVVMGRDLNITYVKGLSRNGSVVEACVPHIQSGKPISYEAGFCVMPSVIDSTEFARQLFGSYVDLGSNVLANVNETGYHGNELLRNAIIGRASSLTTEIGFRRDIHNFWGMIANRLVDETSMRKQTQDTIAIGTQIAENPDDPQLVIDAHSLATMEKARFFADPYSYSEDGYCDPDKVSGFILEGVYTSVDDATRNAPIENRWRGDSDVNGVSKLWGPAFTHLSKLHNLLGSRAVGFYPLGDLRTYQVNPKFCDNPPEAWKGAFWINIGSAKYFLIGMDPSLEKLMGENEGSDYMADRDVVYMVPCCDQIFSDDQQKRQAANIHTALGRKGEPDVVELRDLGHDVYVDYGASNSVVMQSNRKRHEAVLRFTEF